MHYISNNFYRGRLFVISPLLVICLFSFIYNVQAGETSDYVHYRLGLKYKSEKKLDLAVEEFRKVLAAYPDNYNTYMHLAEIRDYQGRYRLAIHNLKRAIAYNPGWGKAQKMLSHIYEKDGQYYNAMKELQDYLQICDPAERDSIQSQIERLVVVIKDGGKSSETVQKAYSGDKKSGVKYGSTRSQEHIIGELSTVSSKGASRRTSGTYPMKNKAAAKEFEAGVAAYSEAVSTNNKSLFNEAITHLRNTLKLQPNHAGAYYYAGLIRRRNGQNSMARINFEKAVSYPKLGFNAHFYLGKIYGEEKEYKKAIEHLNLYISKTDYQPGKDEAKNLIGQYTIAYNALNKDAPKIDVQVLGRDEINPEISKIPEQALYAPIEVRIDSLLCMAIVDTLTDPGQAMLAGVRAFKKNRFDDAINEFKKILAAYPNEDIAARCLYNIGICFMKIKNFQAAESKFQQIIDRHRSHKLALKSLFLKAVSYSERRESAQAEKLFRKFIQKDRNHSWAGKAYEKLGDAYIDLMQDKKAVDAYTQAVDIASNPVDAVYALYKLGDSYSKIGNTTRAVEAFKKAIDLGEKHSIFVRIPDSYYKIADYYYKQKKFEKALEQYRKVTRKYPTYQDTPWGLFQIGSIYKNLKKYKNAIETFNYLISKYPDDYWSRQAQWKLEDTVWEHEYKAVLK